PAPAQPPDGMAPAPPPLPGPPARPVPVRPAVERSPTPPPLPDPPAPSTRPGTIPDGLIDLREPRPPSDGSSHAPRPSVAREARRWVLRVGAAAIEAPGRLGARAWWVAAAVLLLGLAAVWAAPRPPPPPGPPMEPSITNTIGMRFAPIPAGAFLMGSPKGDKMASADEPSPHREWIARPFYLGIHEVTRGQFRRFVEATG